MGLVIHVVGTRVLIKKQDFRPAFIALQNLHGKETCGVRGDLHFAWTNKNMLQTAQNLEDLLCAWRWLPFLDDQGNICELDFTGEKLGDEALLFEQLAPYVTNDSYIDVIDEQGNIWRWLFREGKLIQKVGRLVFD